MVCGSEDNRVYAYCKHVSKHVTSYALDAPPDQCSSANNQFVCSVCWKPSSSVILAANNQGYITICNKTVLTELIALIHYNVQIHNYVCLVPLQCT